MDCPKCIGKLQKLPVTVHKVNEFKAVQGAALQYELEVDQCFVCGGIWFDKGELEKYLTEGLTILDSPSVGSDLDAAFDKKTGKCPVCKIELAKGVHPPDSKTTVDSCSKCGGVWLDSLEIDQLEKISEQHRPKASLWERLLLAILRSRQQKS